eukprot:2836089-Prymnesium_polylepis.1
MRAGTLRYATMIYHSHYGLRSIQLSHRGCCGAGGPGARNPARKPSDPWVLGRRPCVCGPRDRACACCSRQRVSTQEHGYKGTIRSSTSKHPNRVTRILPSPLPGSTFVHKNSRFTPPVLREGDLVAESDDVCRVERKPALHQLSVHTSHLAHHGTCNVEITHSATAHTPTGGGHSALQVSPSRLLMHLVKPRMVRECDPGSRTINKKIECSPICLPGLLSHVCECGCYN